MLATLAGEITVRSSSTRDRVRGGLVVAPCVNDTSSVGSRKSNSPSTADGNEPQNRRRVGWF
jgi:hypothetical protein